MRSRVCQGCGVCAVCWLRAVWERERLTHTCTDTSCRNSSALFMQSRVFHVCIVCLVYVGCVECGVKKRQREGEGEREREGERDTHTNTHKVQQQNSSALFMKHRACRVCSVCSVCVWSVGYRREREKETDRDDDTHNLPQQQCLLHAKPSDSSVFGTCRLCVVWYGVCG